MPAVILIVEDNEVDSLCIRRAFEKAEILNPVACVQSGEEAIEYLKGEEQYANRAEFPFPDLVLLDLKLPGISGFQVLAWIRRQPELKSLRVVMLTGSTDAEHMKLARQLGADSFLVKPADFEVAFKSSGYPASN